MTNNIVACQTEDKSTILDDIRKKNSWSILSHLELWISDNIIDPFMYFSPFFAGLIGLKPELYFLFIPLIPLTLFMFYLYGRRNKRIKKMEDTLEDLDDENNTLKEKNKQLDDDLAKSIQDMELLCKGYLCLLAEGPLGFSESKKSHERVTLYSYDSSGQFFALARYSRNPEFSGNLRPFYPKDQGIISRAWNDGWCFVHNYPDPNEDVEGYRQRCNEDGIPDDNIKELTMPSRLYCGYRITNTQGREQIAVIITESTDPNRYKEKELKKIFKEKDREYLSDLTERLSKWKPNLKDTEERGL